MKTPSIYVVEMFVQYAKWARWEPCAECCLTQRDAQLALRRWRANNPGDRYRLSAYAPVYGKKP